MKTTANIDFMNLIANMEPTGAFALAAALNYNKKLNTTKPVVYIANGGNIPEERLCSLAQK